VDQPRPDASQRSKHPDHRLALPPDLSVAAILARHGERELTQEEFGRHFGHLPADGDG
jgi:hypothetical protein